MIWLSEFDVAILLSPCIPQYSHIQRDLEQITATFNVSRNIVKESGRVYVWCL